MRGGVGGGGVSRPKRTRLLRIFFDVLPYNHFYAVSGTCDVCPNEDLAPGRLDDRDDIEGDLGGPPDRVGTPSRREVAVQKGLGRYR